MDFDVLRESFPLLVPIVALMIPIVAIVAHYMSKSGRERERHETMRQLIKAGQPVPPGWLVDEDEDEVTRRAASRELANPNRSLLPGMVNFSIGVGLMGMFGLMRPGSWLWGIGLIPFCLGLGFIALWFIERAQQKKQPPLA
jgi:hypothetical protein